MKRLVLIYAMLACISSNALAKPTAAPKSSGNDCIRINSVGNYRVLDRNALVIWAPGRRDAYLVELSMPLFALQSSYTLAMIDRDLDGRLCGYGFDRIGVRDFGHPESSTINRMTRLDDAHLVQIEQQYNVKLRPSPKKAADEQNRTGMSF